MTAAVATAAPAAQYLPALVDRASSTLANARSSAEVLEAREMASFAYDAAKRAGRLARAKEAHDELIGAVYRAQADALAIESQAKRRLADEYDAAQERGEVASGRPKTLPDGKTFTADDIGLTHKQVHEARQVRDAERADPGIVRRALNEQVERGREPSKTYLRQIVTEGAMRGLRGPQRQDRRNPLYKPNPQYDAAVGLAGRCRDIIDALDKFDPEYIVGGFADEAHQQRDISVIRECCRRLSAFLEAIDA